MISPPTDAPIETWVKWLSDIDLPPDSKRNIYGRRIRAARKFKFNRPIEDAEPAPEVTDDE